METYHWIFSRVWLSLWNHEKFKPVRFRRLQNLLPALLGRTASNKWGIPMVLSKWDKDPPIDLKGNLDATHLKFLSGHEMIILYS